METTIIIATGAISTIILGFITLRIKSKLRRKKIKEEIIEAIDGQIKARYYI